MRNNFFTRFYITFLAVFFFSTVGFAQDAGSGAVKNSWNGFLVGVIIFLLIICFVFAIVILQLSHLLKDARVANPKPKEVSSFRKWWSNLDKRVFTKAAPLEKEADVLLDHDYDGIKELDNALPPWWKWGFYFTITVAVIYMLRFHVFKTGPTPEQEYNTEMQVAAAKMDLYRSKNKELFDEKTVTLADANGVANGKKIFTGTCFPCHGSKGEGGVGPNLTDKYWIHGGTINDVFKTIKYGVPDKGMQPWGKTFSATDIRNLASFVLSLQGTNPPNPKAPQGNLFEPGKITDSTSVKKDSAAVQTVK